jgi:hypothetical protein
MSKLFTDNKQMMVHIISEVVVLVGITFYFNQKNKKLMAHIEDLAQRVEEQEDLLQKHEQIIKKIVTHIGNQQATQQKSVQPSFVKSTPLRKARAKISPPKKLPVRVQFASEIKESFTDSDSDSDSEVDLDTELQEELNDLLETDDSLKKEPQLKKDV